MYSKPGVYLYLVIIASVFLGSNGQLQNITIDQAPYIVRLKSIYGGHLCGGTLLGPRHVVTAAHCFDEDYANHVLVVAGATTLSDKGVRRKITKLVIHPNYKLDYLRMDVAVLKLDEDMPIDGINISTMPLCSSSKSLGDGDIIQVSGWGKISEEKKVASQNLHTAAVTLMPKDECVKQYMAIASEELPLSEETFGAAICSRPGGTDACRGDSGGPGIHDGELCAIVSGGSQCSDSHMPGVYTSVNLVKDFIEKAMQL